MNTKKCFSLIAAAALLIAGGCVDQREEVAHYETVLHNQPPTTQPVEAPKNLTLAEAMRMANENNEQLAISGEDYLQALIAVNRAFATFLPSVSIGAEDYQAKGYTVPSSIPFPNFTQIFQNWYFNAPLQTQLNVNVLRDATAVSAADIYSTESKDLLLDMQANILLETAQTYYQVLSDEHSVKVLKDTLAVQQANVATMQREEKAGIVLRLDVLQSIAQAAQTQSDLTGAEHDVLNGRATLAFLIGVPSLDSVQLVDGFQTPNKIPDMDQMERIAYTQREDLMAASSAVEVAQKNLSAAYEEFAPTISINFNTFLFRQQFPSDQWWTGLFSVNMPLFEGGMIYADIRNAYSRLRQAQLQQHYLARQVLEQVKISRDNWLNSVQQANNFYIEMTAAVAAWKQAQHSYSVGLATNLDVITAQDQALNAQLAYVRAIYAERTDMLDMVREIGGLTYATLDNISQTGTISWTSLADNSQ
ncbi:MAG TPA: TolC family protein [Phycisphaerae bacterium]|nr:TolC family protein [Phycisphaerae bacterium]